MARPLIVDLYCKAGGAGMGYHRAAFDVLGVDIEPQPRYPFSFVQADALTFLAGAGLANVAAIHASPPCQLYSATRTMHSTRGKVYPDLVEPTRAALMATGLPWILENVAGSPVAPHVVLCGSMLGWGSLRG
jgi:DNA (cytosine-5)-methyltransferase 1